MPVTTESALITRETPEFIEVTTTEGFVHRLNYWAVPARYHEGDVVSLISEITWTSVPNGPAGELVDQADVERYVLG